MKLSIKKPALRLIWVVEAHGLDFHRSTVRREIYSGGREDLAMRSHLEAQALARAFFPGISTNLPYARLVEPLFDDDDGNEDDDGGPPRSFAWARGNWFGGSTDLQGSILGSNIFWIDEHGAKCEVAATLDARERAVVQSLKWRKGASPKPTIQEAAAALQAWEMHVQAPDPKRSRRASTL